MPTVLGRLQVVHLSFRRPSHQPLRRCSSRCELASWVSACKSKQKRSPKIWSKLQRWRRQRAMRPKPPPNLSSLLRRIVTAVAWQRALLMEKPPRKAWRLMLLLEGSSVAMIRRESGQMRPSPRYPQTLWPTATQWLSRSSRRASRGNPADRRFLLKLLNSLKWCSSMQAMLPQLPRRIVQQWRRRLPEAFSAKHMTKREVPVPMMQTCSCMLKICFSCTVVANFYSRIRCWR
mmetsp:Transcript_155011/g.273810  ORF Transcript_155011/g.273810 Transcript_155011/m.273810 type:complete len:233 (-) Transcript_155011:265-963(-)